MAGKNVLIVEDESKIARIAAGLSRRGRFPCNDC